MHSGIKANTIFCLRFLVCMNIGVCPLGQHSTPPIPSLYCLIRWGCLTKHLESESDGCWLLLPLNCRSICKYKLRHRTCSQNGPCFFLHARYSLYHFIRSTSSVVSNCSSSPNMLIYSLYRYYLIYSQWSYLINIRYIITDLIRNIFLIGVKP